MTEDASTAAKIEQLLLPAGVRDLDKAEVARSQRRRLQLALALLARERGYELASIDEIAENAKLSKSTLYQHFGGREALLRSATDDFIEALHTGLQGLAAGSRDWSRLLADGYCALAARIEEEPELARLTFVEGSTIFGYEEGGDGSGDPVSEVLTVILSFASSRASAPPKQPEGMRWRAFCGAFKSTVQGHLRQGTQPEPGEPFVESLVYLTVAAHGPDSETEGFATA